MNSGDCLTEMLSRSVRCIISRSAKSVDRSHLGGVVPKTHENREDSINLGGKIVLDPITKKFRTALGGVKEGGDLTTHTGQKFEEGDFRVNRFLGGKTKHISQNWAIDMIAEEPVIAYDGRRVMCDGTHGGVAKEQGHPRVWINLDDGEIHECMYCGLRYQKKAAYDAALAAAANAVAAES